MESSDAAVMRQVAMDLNGEFGPDLVDVTESVIAKTAPPLETKSRSLGDAISYAEAGMYSLGIAYYLMALVPQMARIWRETRNPEKLREAAQTVARDHSAVLAGPIMSTVNAAVEKRITSSRLNEAKG